jgi:L-serine dehydratase
MDGSLLSRRDEHLSLAQLFTIGVGPSSSHTVGPMRAARLFLEQISDRTAPLTRLECDLYGSLALTGVGHGTDDAVLLGLSGETPELIDVDRAPAIVSRIHASGQLVVDGRFPIRFTPGADLRLNRGVFRPGHSNAMVFTATFADGATEQQEFHSIGGGEVVAAGAERPRLGNVEPRHAFRSAAELLDLADQQRMSIADVVRANEVAWRTPEETDAVVDAILAAMSASIDRGCVREGILPGGLEVPRRAPGIYKALSAKTSAQQSSSDMFDWVSLWAIAVNEENAAHGRVVTAPTNGAAGVIPAVLRYYETFVPSAKAQGARDFIYTAAAIGFLYKKRASISAAEMGCQGEVGVACSMAAAGLTAVLGGTNLQIENAAEIGMEHNLGLTCDPVGGLVQIPCIERNTMGAIKAINAAHLAMHGNGEHHVSLDAVIETMRQTGNDMSTRYKETSLGGLAVNVPVC